MRCGAHGAVGTVTTKTRARDTTFCRRPRASTRSCGFTIGASPSWASPRPGSDGRAARPEDAVPARSEPGLVEVPHRLSVGAHMPIVAVWFAASRLQRCSCSDWLLGPQPAVRAPVRGDALPSAQYRSLRSPSRRTLARWCPSPRCSPYSEQQQSRAHRGWRGASARSGPASSQSAAHHLGC